MIADIDNEISALISQLIRADDDQRKLLSARIYCLQDERIRTMGSQTRSVYQRIEDLLWKKT